MSISYDVCVTLNIEYERSHIKTILQRCQQQGFVFVEDFTNPTAPLHAPITFEEAVNKAYRVNQNSTEDYYGVLALHEDSSSFFWFYSTSDNKLEFTWGGFGVPVRKDFVYNRQYYIDFDFYIRLMVQICQDFTILKLYTYDFLAPLLNIFSTYSEKL